MDRKWADILQELRVMQTGAQLIAGILLTLPFQESFDDLDDPELVTYLVLVGLAALTTALVMTPVAAHRRLSGMRRKERLVAVAEVLVQVVVATVACLVVGMTVFAFDLVVGLRWGLIAGGVTAIVMFALLVMLPQRLVSGDP